MKNYPRYWWVYSTSRASDEYILFAFKCSHKAFQFRLDRCRNFNLDVGMLAQKRSEGWARAHVEKYIGPVAGADYSRAGKARATLTVARQFSALPPWSQ